jgi:spore coat protein W
LKGGLWVDDLKKAILAELKKPNRNSMMDLLVSDVLERNGISEGSLKNLTEEQKNKIRSVFNQVQSNLDELLK